MGLESAASFDVVEALTVKAEERLAVDESADVDIEEEACLRTLACCCWVPAVVHVGNAHSVPYTEVEELQVNSGTDHCWVDTVDDLTHCTCSSVVTKKAAYVDVDHGVVAVVVDEPKGTVLGMVTFEQQVQEEVLLPFGMVLA